jgi:hypothetical protein
MNSQQLNSLYDRLMVLMSETSEIDFKDVQAQVFASEIEGIMIQVGKAATAKEEEENGN